MTDAPDMEPAALEACPFCDGEPQLIDGGPGNFYVRCVQCNATGDDGSRDYALSRWNRRAARSAPEAGKAVDELTAAVEAGLAFGYDPATGFVHADDGGAPASCIFYEPKSALASSPAPTGAEPVAWRFKPLEWEYHERPAYTYTARDERGLIYHINQGFGSDSYYFATVRFDGVMIYEGDDLQAAQAAAQTDYERHISSALEGPRIPAVREFQNELGARIRITIEGPTSLSENVITPMEARELRAALNETRLP